MRTFAQKTTTNGMTQILEAMEKKGVTAHALRHACRLSWRQVQVLRGQRPGTLNERTLRRIMAHLKIRTLTLTQ